MFLMVGVFCHEYKIDFIYVSLYLSLPLHFTFRNKEKSWKFRWWNGEREKRKFQSAYGMVYSLTTGTSDVEIKTAACAKKANHIIKKNIDIRCALIGVCVCMFAILLKWQYPIHGKLVRPKFVNTIRWLIFNWVAHVMCQIHLYVFFMWNHMQRIYLVSSASIAAHTLPFCIFYCGHANSSIKC